MRNILQYPITDQEVLTAMDNALEQYRNKGIIVGGIDGYILAKIKDFLESDPDSMHKIVESLKIKKA